MQMNSHLVRIHFIPLQLISNSAKLWNKMNDGTINKFDVW